MSHRHGVQVGMAAVVSVDTEVAQAWAWVCIKGCEAVPQCVC